MGSGPARFEEDFGCLPLAKPVEWSWGRITPRVDQSDAWEAIRAGAHVKTGIVYPPEQVTSQQDPRTGDWERLEGSERPAPMFSLQPTHRIEIEHSEISGDPDADRQRLAGFIVYFTGFLLGLRAQFAEWKVYGPVHVDRERGFLASPSEIGRCLDAVEPAWVEFNAKQRRTVVNLLFQLARVPAMDWEWDRFAVTYAVADACYNILATQRGLSDKGGAKRWKCVSDLLNIPYDDDAKETIKRLVRLRNQLVHELGWGDHMLGHGYPSDDVPPDLHAGAFVERAILGMLGVPARFVETAWWDRGALQTHGLGL